MASPFYVALLPLIALAFAVAGIVMIALGTRGRPVFGLPRCAKCNYDLRNMSFATVPDGAEIKCPECGQSLADPAAVTFGKWQPQRKRILAGVIVILAPWLFVGLLFVAARLFAARSTPIGLTPVTPAGAYLSPQQRAALPTPALLARLKVDEPWGWQELERRRAAGQLSQADADAAIGALITDINAKRARNGGRREPLHWVDTFLKPAIKNGNLSAQQIQKLAQAFYGADLPIVMRSVARQGQPIMLTLNENQAWELPGHEMVWCLTSIVADGSIKLEPRSRYYNPRRQGQPPAPMQPDELSARAREGEMQLQLPHELSVGEHEITITRQMGLIPENSTMRGLDGKPGTPDKWPSPVTQWQSVVKKKIKVVPPGASVLEVITDPNRDPFRNGDAIVIEEALTRSSKNGVELVLKFRVSGQVTPLVSYHVYVQAGGDKLDFGTLVAGTDPVRGGYGPGTQQRTFKSLDPSIRTIDVIFELDEKPAEQFPGIEKVWGGPYRIDKVKLQRFDTQATTTTTAN